MITPANPSFGGVSNIITVKFCFPALTKSTKLMNHDLFDQISCKHILTVVDGNEGRTDCLETFRNVKNYSLVYFAMKYNSESFYGCRYLLTLSWIHFYKINMSDIISIHE